MGKPHIDVYRKFADMFYASTKKAGKKQYLVPYLMSSHPGSTLKEAVELAEYIRDLGYMPEQVQDFYPTPGTVATCMFYTGMNPYTLEPVFVPRTPEEKSMQRALLQYFLPQNHRLVVKGLKMAGRTDLIGTGPGCLVKPLEEPNGQPRRPAGKSAGKLSGKPVSKTAVKPGKASMGKSGKGKTGGRNYDAAGGKNSGGRRKR